MWFCTKKCKIKKVNLYLSKDQFGRYEICFTEDNHSYMSNICAKNYQIQTLWQLRARYWFFKVLRIAHIHKNCNSLSIVILKDIIIFKTNASAL